METPLVQSQGERGRIMLSGLYYLPVKAWVAIGCHRSGKKGKSSILEVKRHPPDKRTVCLASNKTTVIFSSTTESRPSVSTMYGYYCCTSCRRPAAHHYVSLLLLFQYRINQNSTDPHPRGGGGSDFDIGWCTVPSRRRSPTVMPFCAASRWWCTLPRRTPRSTTIVKKMLPLDLVRASLHSSCPPLKLNSWTQQTVCLTLRV